MTNPETEMLDFSLPRTFSGGDIVLAVVLIIAGFAAVTLLDHVSSGNNIIVKRLTGKK